MTPQQVADEFGLSKETVTSTKYAYQCTYQELFDEYKHRLDILKQCQEVCLNVMPNDIEHFFNGKTKKSRLSAAWNFLNYSLYSFKTLPKKNYIAKCEKIVEYLKGKDGQRIKDLSSN